MRRWSARKSLEAAGAIPDEPLTRGQKVFRGAGVVVVLLLLTWGGWATYGWWNARKEKAAVESVVNFAKSSAVKAVGHEGAAALHLALGDYYRQRRRSDAATKAREQFRLALGHLGEADVASTEKDAILIDLALAQVEMADLVGQDLENGQKLKWSDVHKSLVGSLAAIHDEEARLEALRAVTRRLIARGQGQQALDLANQVFTTGTDVPRTEAVAAIGLELFSAGQKALAESAAEKSLTADKIVEKREDDPDGPMKDPNPNRAPEKPFITSSVKALSLVIGRPTVGYVEDDDNPQIGVAQGLRARASGRRHGKRSKMCKVEQFSVS